MPSIAIVPVGKSMLAVLVTQSAAVETAGQVGMDGGGALEPVFKARMFARLGT